MSRTSRKPPIVNAPTPRSRKRSKKSKSKKRKYARTGLFATRSAPLPTVREIEFEALYESSSGTDQLSSDDELDWDKYEMTASLQAQDAIVIDENRRVLATNNHSYTAFESVMIECCMFATYLFVVIAIGLITFSSVYWKKSKWFETLIIGFFTSTMLALLSFVLYKRVESQIESNQLSAFVLFDRKRNTFEIYDQHRTHVCCDNFTLKNECKLFWKCQLDALHRVEYVNEEKAIFVYYYNSSNTNDDFAFKKFETGYFVSKKWEKNINHNLKNCQYEWEITTDMGSH